MWDPKVYHPDLLSWPRDPAPLVGEAFRYQAISGHESSNRWDERVFALDWFSGDGPEGRRVLHQLTVPQVTAEWIGLAFTALTCAADVAACAEAAGYTVVAGTPNACFRGADPAIAALLGFPDTGNLWTVSCDARAQLPDAGRRGDAGRRRAADKRADSSIPLFSERVYTW